MHHGTKWKSIKSHTMNSRLPYFHSLQSHRQSFCADASTYSIQQNVPLKAPIQTGVHSVLHAAFFFFKNLIYQVELFM
jgi:hypothetical protein